MEGIIEHITPSKIQFRVGEKLFEFEIEALLPGYGSPNFIIYPADISELASDGSRNDVSESERKDLLTALCEQLKQQNMTYEIE